MKIPAFCIAGVLFSLSLAAFPQTMKTGMAASLAGDWDGTLAGKLPLVLHLRVNSEGELTATMDSPAQGASRLKVEDVRINKRNLSFDLPDIHGTYKGHVSADGKTIDGNWSQGTPMPLEWKQVTTAAELTQEKSSPLDGTWNGVLRAGNISLRVAFHFHSEPSGGLVCTMDSLDQGVMNIPCSAAEFKDKRLKLEVPSVHGSYEGTLSKDGKSINGTWSQGSPLPLDLERSEQQSQNIPALLPARPPVALNDLKPVLDSEFAPLLRSWPQLGVVLGVIENGKSRIMAWGEAKPDSIFEIGSVTKTFTALILAQMVVQKQVSLNEPVANLLPSGTILQSSGSEITLLDLATHFSGLPRLPGNMEPSNPANPYGDYTAEKLLAYLRQHGLTRPLHPHFLYSNLGFGLLGYALSLRAGTPYAEIVRNEITEPLGMQNTVLGLSRAQRKRFLQGYDAVHDAVRPWDLDVMAGAGALRSTAGDLLRYCDALMNSAQFINAPSRNARTLAESIPLALKPERDADSGADSVMVALAWLSEPRVGSYWHEGGTGGFTSLVSFNPGRRRAIIVLYNCEDNTPGQLPLTEKIAANVSALLDGDSAIPIS